jgi:hypothetical protein
VLQAHIAALRLVASLVHRNLFPSSLYPSRSPTVLKLSRHIGFAYTRSWHAVTAKPPPPRYGHLKRVFLPSIFP